MTSPHKRKRISTLQSYKFELQRKKKCQQTRRSDNGDDEEEAHCLSNGSLRAAATSVQTDGFSLNEGNRVDSNMIIRPKKNVKRWRTWAWSDDGDCLLVAVAILL